ncbi:MAG: hypothetical protein ACOX5S_02650 [Patescibacteria group bacterium]|jgi:hypothetical protein
MVEREIMPTPEQERPLSAEQARQPSFEERLRGLIEPKKDEEEKVLQEAAIRNEKLQRLGRLALESRNQTPEGLGKLLGKGDDWCLDEQVPEDEWSVLAGELGEERERLLREQELSEEGGEVNQKAMPTEIKLSGLDKFMGRMKDLQEETIKSTQKNQESTENLIKMAIGYNERTREAYSQLPPEEEKERWVDVELQQDFYTRFTPNMEPRFYIEASSEERRDWDARWQLARAAYWKKVHYASPKELTEDLDWIQLTNTVEQAERLYNIEGVKQSLEWYADEIINGTTKIVDKGSGEEEEFCLVECESGAELNEFRKKLQDYLARSVFGVSREMESQMSEEERQKLRIKVKSADAIAWNWIWCSNLIESVDSRYSLQGPRDLRERHAWVPALCSEALRTVYHPQERFEDECANGFEWGAFGKWGVLQIERIKKETGKEAEDFIFKGANSPSQFWRYEVEGKKGKILIYVPECYPVTTMKSFWETYSDDSQGKVSLLERLLRKEKIDWSRTQSNLTSEDHFFLISKEAVELLEYFSPGRPLREEKIGEWVVPLLDIFRTLRLERNLEEYYEERGSSKETAIRHFHNLKVWAVYAGYGGVRNPEKRGITSPFGVTDRLVFESLLKEHPLGYLEKRGAFARERLDIQ